MKTSCSDNSSYPQFCIDALNNQIVFNSFRQNSIYTSIVETVGFQDGKNYLELFLKKRPNYSKYLKKFSQNDTIGSPIKYPYNFGFLNFKKVYFSPTTLRYINTLADLEVFYKCLDGFDIVEIGAGYGGLCRIISERYKFKSYTIIDIESSLNLAKKYLNYFNLKNTFFLPPDEVLASNNKYDLVISNYAFSEVNREWQEVYFSKVLANSVRGYMLCNFYSHTWEKNQYSEPELLDLIENCKLITTSKILSDVDIKSKISLLKWGSSK